MRALEVLIADNSPNIELFSRAISTWKAHVNLTIFSDGKELFDKLPKTQIIPDLIAVSHHLPWKNGLETIRFVREQLKWIQTPIVIMSSSMDQFTIERISDHPNTYFLETSIDFKKFKRSISDLENLIGLREN